MRTIDAEALKKAIDDYAEKRQDTLLWQADIEEIIDNAPTVDIKDEIAGAYNEGYMCGNKEAEKGRPQGDIRWTDKVYLTGSGDIIDFEGRVVGHINLEDMKGGAE